MAKLTWHETGERVYETGVEQVALFVMNDDGTYKKGEAWNGVTAINESPSGGEASDLYADDQKYISLYSEEELGMSIEAYTYPDEWGLCDGSAIIGGGLELKQQRRVGFGLAYKTKVGNDVLGNDYGEKLHLVYGCKASPSERAYSTINESPEAITFSWTITTTKQPLGSDDYKDTAMITIDTSRLTGGKDNEAYQELLAKVYGTDGDSTATPEVPATDPELPDIATVIALFDDSNG